jgi:hypothetical protein
MRGGMKESTGRDVICSSHGEFMVELGFLAVAAWATDVIVMMVDSVIDSCRLKNWRERKRGWFWSVVKHEMAAVVECEGGAAGELELGTGSDLG